VGLALLPALEYWTVDRFWPSLRSLGTGKGFCFGFLGVYRKLAVVRALPIAHLTDTVSFCAGCWRGNAAVLQPSLGAESVPEKLAGRAQDYMTTAHHVGVIIGPSIGGLMIDYLSWRYSFFFLVPIGICGTLLSLVNLKRRQLNSKHRAVSIDYLGAALLFATTTALVMLLDRRTQQMMAVSSKTALAVLFCLCVVGLIVHETRTKTPILNFDVV
jgi:MFS family permease